MNNKSEELRGGKRGQQLLLTLQPLVPNFLFLSSNHLNHHHPLKELCVQVKKFIYNLCTNRERYYTTTSYTRSISLPHFVLWGEKVAIKLHNNNFIQAPDNLIPKVPEIMLLLCLCMYLVTWYPLLDNWSWLENNPTATTYLVEGFTSLRRNRSRCPPMFAEDSNNRGMCYVYVICFTPSLLTYGYTWNSNIRKCVVFSFHSSTQEIFNSECVCHQKLSSFIPKRQPQKPMKREV